MTLRAAVYIQAVEAYTDLLFALDSDEPATAIYGRLCEATCRLADMERAAIFIYADALRRVPAAGSHGIEPERFEHVFVTVKDAPVAFRALTEDRVLEATGAFPPHLPPVHIGFLRDTRLVCTPIIAAGRWFG